MSISCSKKCNKQHTDTPAVDWCAKNFKILGTLHRNDFLCPDRNAEWESFLEAIQRVSGIFVFRNVWIHHDFSIILNNIYKDVQIWGCKVVGLEVQSWVGNETSVKKDTTLYV